jgi:hypothetical protein
MELVEQSKEENIRFLSCWNTKYSNEHTIDINAFLIPFVNDMQKLLCEGNLFNDK